MRVIVSDTSPIGYLVLIGLDSLLQQLYGHVLIPQAVANELQRSRTPHAVQEWMNSPPSWIEIIPSSSAVQTHSISASLDPGEREVLQLALNFCADLILMDERAGVEEARRIGLAATGTLGILARCAERGWIKLKPALEMLQNTNFRVNPRLIEQMLAAEKDTSDPQA